MPLWSHHGTYVVREARLADQALKWCLGYFQFFTTNFVCFAPNDDMLNGSYERIKKICKTLHYKLSKGVRHLSFLSASIFYFDVKTDFWNISFGHWKLAKWQ